MKTCFSLLLKELQRLSEALPETNKLLLKENGNGLECQFLMGGIVLQLVHIRSNALATALLQASINGIIEGAAYTVFRESFSSFALHVKTQVLYEELTLSQPSFKPVFHNLLVA